MKRLISTVLGILGSAALAPAATTLYLQGSVDLTGATDPNNAGTYIGTNAAAVAWDGTNVYAAGFINSSSATNLNVGLIKVSNALTAPTLGTVFGQRATPVFRGYIGMDIGSLNPGSGAITELPVTYDDGSGTGTIAAYGTDGSQIFSVAAAGRPLGGPAADPSINRISYEIWGSRFIRNVNPGTGAQTGTADPTGGTPIPGDPLQNRDLAFNAGNGDAWIRDNNDVIHAIRSGASTYSGASIAVDLPSNSGALETNIAYVNHPGDAFAIFNDHGNTSSTTQSFTDVVKAVLDNGTLEPLTFLNSDGSAFAPATGTGEYDFSWNAATQTLAIGDFANNHVYVFGFTAVPEPTSLTLIAAGACAALAARRRRRA